jgi:hypothetical protein
VRQPTGAIKLNESLSHWEEAAYFFEEAFELYGLDDYDLKLDAILPAAFNLTDFGAVAEIVDGAAISTVECTLLCQSSDIFKTGTGQHNMQNIQVYIPNIPVNIPNIRCIYQYILQIIPSCARLRHL